MNETPLTAENLKQELWDTLQSLKKKEIDFHTVLATAGASREIMRVIKMQLQVSDACQEKPQQKVLDFTK